MYLGDTQVFYGRDFVTCGYAVERRTVSVEINRILRLWGCEPRKSSSRSFRVLMNEGDCPTSSGVSLTISEVRARPGTLVGPLSTECSNLSSDQVQSESPHGQSVPQ